MYDLIQVLSQLVSIPSVNPMGKPETGDPFGESRLTEHLQVAFQGMGLPWERFEVEPGRENIVARLDGNPPADRGGGLVLLGVHQDTVPVEGMAIEPFVPVVRDGRVYGRGACDVKGGMTAMLAALGRLSVERPQNMPTVVMACTVNEECGFTGARALAEACLGRVGTIIPRKPDAAVIAEPTDLNVVVAHKGVVRWRCHTLGRAGHSAAPDKGQNAIYKMAPVLQAVEDYQREVVGRLASHPLCGRPTVSVGTIQGGVSVNTIPDRCTIEVDRRLCPGEDAASAYDHLSAHVASRPGIQASAHHDPPFMEGPALTDDANGPVADCLAAVAREVAGDCQRIGVPYATDAAFLAAVGIPTVVFGPGSIEQAHTADEWIAVDQLEPAAEILYRFALAAHAMRA